MKVLNLYAGLLGNRRLWPDHVEVTNVELNSQICGVIERQFPQDTLITDDAHQYLLDHANEYDFIWSSPPCQSHSRMIRSGKNRKPRYPDLKLYEEILFLQHNFKGIWVVENVVPYYDYLVGPEAVIGRHVFWSNFSLDGIEDVPRPANFINQTTLAGRRALLDWLGFDMDEVIYYDGNHCPAQVLRNCVHPELGRQVMDRAIEVLMCS